MRRLLARTWLTLIVLGTAAPVAAHNCSNQSDCQQTAGYNATVAVAGGLIALGAGLLGGSVGGLAGEMAPGTAGRRRPAAPVLYDPDTDEPLIVQDGTWEGGETGDVWYDGWVSREEAERRIAERQAQLAARQREIDAFSRETERDRDARREKRNEKLAREGYVYDPESDTWVLDRSATVDGRDNQGFDQSGYDRDGYDRDGFNASGFDREGYGRNGFNRDGVNAGGERIEDARARLQARQEAREDSSSGWTPWLSGYGEGWIEGVKKDVMDLPQVAADAAAAVVDGTVEVLRAATDPENWRVVGETVVGTGHDIFVDPAAGAKKAWQSSKDAGGAAAQLAKAVAQNPVLVAKAVIGLDNWEKAMDPKVPLSQRIASVLMGTLDIGMNLAGAGAAKAVGKVDDLVDASRAVKAADAAADASRGAKAADAAADASRGAKAADAAADVSRTAKAADKAGDARRSADAAADASKVKKPKDLPTREQANEAARIYRESPEYQKYKREAAQASATRAEQGTVVRQPVGIDDYKPAIDPGSGLPLKPDVRGMPPNNVRHAQVVADKYGVKVQVRPTNKDAKALLESGRALPKPAKIKAKTVNDLDIALGAPTGSNGKVAVFWPKDPPGVAQGMVRDRAALDAWTKSNPALSKRWEQRMKEFGNEMSDMEKLAAEGKIVWDPSNPIILDKKTGLPFTGDHDVFDIRGINGERISPSVRAQIMKELEGPPYRNQHGAHMDWDYEGKPHFAKNKAIDERILNGHMEGADNAEALVTVAADAEPTASWFSLGRRN